MALYGALVVKAELGLPIDTQLGLFASERGVLWIDGAPAPSPATIAQNQWSESSDRSRVDSCKSVLNPETGE